MARLDLNNRQVKLLAGHGISYDYGDMTDGQLLDLEEQAGELLVYEGLDENYDDNDKGREYRDIIMKLAAI